MTVSNGQTILETDLDGIATGVIAANCSLPLIQADNAQVPGGAEYAVTFYNPTSALRTSNPERFKTVWVPPCDCYLESLAVEAGDLSNPSTVTVALTATAAIGAATTAQVTDPLSLWQVTATGSIAGTGRLSRLLYDNTKTTQKNFVTTAKAHRTLLKGSTLKIDVDPGANAVAASMIRVVLCWRAFFSRE